MSGAVAPRVQTELKAVSTIMVANHSFNIIDLIEVGDYVNGYLIMQNEGKLPSDGRTCFVVFKRCEHNYMKVWDEQDIRDIVTREQFENMKYVVGDK